MFVFNRPFMNDCRESVDTNPVGMGDVGATVFFSFEDIGKYGENTSHFSTCLQFHFPYNLAK